METDGFDVMTATQIIQSAGVNRSTFYAHYADKYELLNKQVDQLIGKLTDAAYRHAPMTQEGSIAFAGGELQAYLTNIGAIFEQDAEKYQTILPEHAELLCSKFEGAAHAVWEKTRHHRNAYGSRALRACRRLRHDIEPYRRMAWLRGR